MCFLCERLLFLRFSFSYLSVQLDVFYCLKEKATKSECILLDFYCEFTMLIRKLTSSKESVIFYWIPISIHRVVASSPSSIFKVICTLHSEGDVVYIFS